MSADHYLGLPISDAIASLLFLLCRKAPFEQIKAVFDWSKEAAERKIMLFCKNFCRRHNGDLAPILDSDDGSLSRHNGFP